MPKLRHNVASLERAAKMKTYECKAKHNFTMRAVLLKYLAGLKFLDDVADIKVKLSDKDGDKVYLTIPDDVSNETLKLLGELWAHNMELPDELKQRIEKAWEE